MLPQIKLIIHDSLFFSAKFSFAPRKMSLIGFALDASTKNAVPSLVHQSNITASGTAPKETVDIHSVIRWLLVVASAISSGSTFAPAVFALKSLYSTSSATRLVVTIFFHLALSVTALVLILLTTLIYLDFVQENISVGEIPWMVVLGGAATSVGNIIFLFVSLPGVGLGVSVTLAAVTQGILLWGLPHIDRLVLSNNLLQYQGHHSVVFLPSFAVSTLVLVIITVIMIYKTKKTRWCMQADQTETEHDYTSYVHNNHRDHEVRTNSNTPTSHRGTPSTDQSPRNRNFNYSAFINNPYRTFTYGRSPRMSDLDNSPCRFVDYRGTSSATDFKSTRSSINSAADGYDHEREIDSYYNNTSHAARNRLSSDLGVMSSSDYDVFLSYPHSPLVQSSAIANHNGDFPSTVNAPSVAVAAFSSVCSGAIFALGNIPMSRWGSERVSVIYLLVPFCCGMVLMSALLTVIAVAIQKISTTSILPEEVTAGELRSLNQGLNIQHLETMSEDVSHQRSTCSHWCRIMLFAAKAGLLIAINFECRAYVSRNSHITATGSVLKMSYHKPHHSPNSSQFIDGSDNVTTVRLLHPYYFLDMNEPFVLAVSAAVAWVWAILRFKEVGSAIGKFIIVLIAIFLLIWAVCLFLVLREFSFSLS